MTGRQKSRSIPSPSSAGMNGGMACPSIWTRGPSARRQGGGEGGIGGGGEWVVWGERGCGPPRGVRGGAASTGGYFFEGARLHPVCARGKRIRGAGARPERNNPAAVWTGNEMIVWGGTAVI